MIPPDCPVLGEALRLAGKDLASWLEVVKPDAGVKLLAIAVVSVKVAAVVGATSDTKSLGIGAFAVLFGVMVEMLLSENVEPLFSGLVVLLSESELEFSESSRPPLRLAIRSANPPAPD